MEIGSIYEIFFHVFLFQTERQPCHSIPGKVLLISQYISLPIDMINLHCQHQHSEILKINIQHILWSKFCMFLNFKTET